MAADVRVKKSTLYLIVLVLILFFVIMVALRTIIAPIYGYMGLEIDEGEFSYYREFIGFCALVVLISFLRNESIKLLLLFQIIVPILSIFLLHSGGLVTTETLLITSSAILIVTVVASAARFRYRVTVFHSEKGLIYFGCAVVVTYLILLLHQRGFGNIVTSFDKVYEYRAQTEGTYLLAMVRSTAIAFVSVIFAYGLVKKDTTLQALSIAVFVLLFIYSGHKRFLFLIPFIVMAYIAVQSGRAYYVALIYVITLLIAQVIFYSVGWLSPISFLGRRAILMPGLLTGYYVEYFSEFGPLWFSHSKVGLLLGTYDPTIMAPARTIGEIFTRGGSANANWIASSYMNMGPLGILIYGPIVGVLFALPGALRGEENRKIFLIAGVSVYSSFMQNSDLVTSFLSNGVAVYLLIWALWGNCRMVRAR